MEVDGENSVDSSNNMDANDSDAKIFPEQEPVDDEGNECGPGPSSPSDDPLIASLSNQVFENALIREKILKSIIFSHGRVNRNQICELRLVRKSWLQTVSDLLRKYRESLLCVTLDRENSVDGTSFCNENGKMLRQFNNILANAITSDGTDHKIPTFALHLLPDFFRRENYEDLAECLVHYGSGLTEMNLAFPVNSSMTFVFHSFTLPKLTRLSVQFSDQRLHDTAIPQLQNNGHSIYPLQTIMNASSELSLVQFKFTTSEMYIPFGFDYLNLPYTVKELFLDCPMKNQDLEVLLRNDLPNLRHLRLFGTNNPYAEGLIYRILSKYRSTLQILNLRGSHYHGRVRNTTLFRLPVMEKLETLTVTSQTWELEEDVDNPMGWHVFLPKLREFRMLHQTDHLYKKWVSHSAYESVSRLFISLMTGNANQGGYMGMGEQPLTFNLERMQLLHRAFPNVVCLELSICGNKTCGLKYMFMEMQNLQKLAITVRGTPDQSQLIHWDALFIGAPIDMANSLKRNPDFWDNIELKDDNNYPSIRKLADLRSLALVENYLYGGHAGGSGSIDLSGHHSLISDLSFRFAFFKMPKLKHLLLSGRFRASTATAEKWRQEKGAIIHSIKRFA